MKKLYKPFSVYYYLNALQHTYYNLSKLFKVYFTKKDDYVYLCNKADNKYLIKVMPNDIRRVFELGRILHIIQNYEVEKYLFHPEL